MTEHPSNLDAPDSSQSADWEAIARHLAGEDTPDSAARVAALMGESSDRVIVASLDRAASRMANDVPSDLDVEDALRNVRARMSDVGVRPFKLDRAGRNVTAPVQSTRWRVPFPAIAAVGLVAIGLGTWLTVGKLSQPAPVALSAPRMVATGVGMRDSLRLPDGTKVVLGPMSSVRVASGYKTGNREVEIRGDAYFDVVHNAARPFTVHAGNATIQDVGTRFVVHADVVGGIGVSVSEGSVSLTPMQSPGSTVVLKAGDRGSLDQGGRIVTRRGAASADDMAWLNGHLVFRETPISEVVIAMRRWYGIELQLADPSLASRHLTATFSGEPPDRVLEVLRLALGADIETRGDTAIVRLAKGRVR